ncbi:MAG: GTP cyclohydrolase I FolE [Myxococcales bacterium]|nr:GTP cyclohydrolase I FolE [Myxococcales bacterium]
MHDLNVNSSTAGGWGHVTALPGVDDGSRAPVDLPRIARAVREILIAIGEDPDREGLLDTPDRVARAYRDLTAGMRQDPGDHLRTVFQEGGDDLVVVRGIELHSLCEHHLLPFSGVAHVAYLPAGGRVVGLSKIARTVEAFARRPQVQERLTRQIADAMLEHLAPRGVSVLIESEHLCMKMRGVAKQGASMTTVAHRGAFATDATQRGEVLSMLRNRGER